MRKKFAEDDLLGRFRLKNNPTLRIDLKPTPPEQVEEVIKNMEPLIENLGNAEQSQSGLSIDWDTNEIEVPANMPSDEELKAILFREPKDEVPPEQIDIFKSQRHQKMLELLAKVEALTQRASVEQTQINEALSESPVEHASDNLRDTKIEGSLFNGEEAEMRSDTEQFQSVQGKQTAAESQPSATKTNDSRSVETEFKLDVDQKDFQDRLIKILNENYSDLGEIRPHNLKSRLIEILNEEYAEDYFDDEDFVEDDFKMDDHNENSPDQDDFDKDVFEEDSVDEDGLDEDDLDEDDLDEEDTDVANSDEDNADSEAFNRLIEVSNEPEVTEILSEFGFIKSSEVDEETEQETGNESVQLTNNSEKPKIVLPGMRDASGFLSEDYNHNDPDSKMHFEFSKPSSEDQPSDYPPVGRNRERFSHFQYVTSFQEVTDSEAASEESTEMAEADVPSENDYPWVPQPIADEESNLTMDLSSDSESSPESDQSSVEADRLGVKRSTEVRKDEHPWLKELREEGGEDDIIPETSEPQPELEHKWASAEVFGDTEQSSEQEMVQERVIERDHRQEEVQVPKAERLFGTDAAESVKNDGTVSDKKLVQNGERFMSVEEWSFVFDTLKEQIDYLRKQLEIKDHQLQNKDELIRNFQILLKNEQDKFLRLENKMEDVVLQVEERAAKKGFFSRFRKR
jgi:hypothetical protein